MTLELILQLASITLILASGPAIIFLVSLRQGNH